MSNCYKYSQSSSFPNDIFSTLINQFEFVLLQVHIFQIEPRTQQVQVTRNLTYWWLTIMVVILIDWRYIVANILSQREARNFKSFQCICGQKMTTYLLGLCVVCTLHHIGSTKANCFVVKNLQFRFCLKVFLLNPETWTFLKLQSIRFSYYTYEKWIDMYVTNLDCGIQKLD